MNLWRLLLICAGGVLFVAFFMPWWGLTETVPERPEMSRLNDRAAIESARKEYEKRTEKVAKGTRVKIKNARWYSAYDILSKLHDAEKDAKADRDKDDTSAYSATVRVWGWSVGVALTGFIFCFAFSAIGLVPMFVRPYRRWCWISSFAAGVMGLILLILAMVWYFGSPGENVSGVLSQGVGLSPGPYLALLGSLAATGGGVCDGVFGLLAFLKGAKRRPAEPALELDDEEF